VLNRQGQDNFCRHPPKNPAWFCQQADCLCLSQDLLSSLPADVCMPYFIRAVDVVRSRRFVAHLGRGCYAVRILVELDHEAVQCELRAVVQL
jgi:hypothetical protein